MPTILRRPGWLLPSLNHACRVLILPFLLGGAGLPSHAKETWTEVKSPNFVAYTNAGEDEARKALVGFEGIRSVFGKVFPGLRVDAPKPMFVVVVGSEASMATFLPKSFEGKHPTRPAGVFISGMDRNYAILRSDINLQVDQPYFVVFHEYTHSIIHLNFPGLPTWLDEGIADFYGATEIRSGKVFLGRVPEDRLATIRRLPRLPLETLLTVTHASPYYQEGDRTGIFYAESWALVHYLFMDEQAKKAGLLQAYMKAYSRETDPLSAARSGFGDLAKFEETLGHYIRRPTLAFWNLPLTVSQSDKDFEKRPLDAAEALVIRAEFLQHAGQEEAARPLLAQALALNPQSPAAHVAQGMGAKLRGEGALARASFKEAVRLGSGDFRPYYYLAQLAQEGPGSGADDSAQIMAWLDSARRLRPDFPDIHMALSRQYEQQRDVAGALREGKAGVALDPANLFNRVNLGYACLNLDLEDEAKAIGEQLNRIARTQDERILADRYGAHLAEHLSQKRARALERLEVGGAQGRPSTVEVQQARPLKFSLPSHLAPLGAEVMQLAAEGKIQEAVAKVQKALAQAKYPYDRKALKALLDSLESRNSKK